MKRIIVKTPRGAVFSTKTDIGEIRAELVFFESAFNKREQSFSNAQKWLDNKILKDCDPYVPMRTGALKQSGILGTVIGSGEIRYIAPYARSQYYAGFQPSKSVHPLASRLWFEVAKAAHRDSWISGFKTIVRRGDTL